MPLSSTLLERIRPHLKCERTWLITGVAGFIGSNLLEALLEMGETVVGLDNFATGKRKNLDDVRDSVGPTAWRQFRFIEGDIRDPAACVEACRGIDVVLHQAALGSVPRSIENPLATHQTNIDGFLNMLLAARDASVARFVYAASSSTYGDSTELPKVETRIGKPLSPYAVTKYVNELYASVFHRVYGLQTIGLRYFNVFGPRQDPSGPYAAVIPNWIGALLHGKPCRINGDGENSRDFCYVENVIQANVLAATVNVPDALDQVYNIALNARISLNELYAQLCDELGDNVLVKQPPVYAPSRSGDVKHSQADISKAAGLLAYSPTHSVSDGLKCTVAWYVANISRALA